MEPSTRIDLQDCANEDASHYNVPSGSMRRKARARSIEITDKGLAALGQTELARTRQFLAVASAQLREALEQVRQQNVMIDALHHEADRYSDLVFFLKEHALELKRFSGDDSWEMRFSAGEFGYIACGATLESCVENAQAKLGAA